MPCPQGIMILGVLDLVKGTMLSSEKKNKAYHDVVKGIFKSDPADCVECGECVEKCPFKLPIPSLMRRAIEMFEKEPMV